MPSSPACSPTRHGVDPEEEPLERRVHAHHDPGAAHDQHRVARGLGEGLGSHEPLVTGDYPADVFERGVLRPAPERIHMGRPLSVRRGIAARVLPQLVDARW